MQARQFGDKLEIDMHCRITAIALVFAAPFAYAQVSGSSSNSPGFVNQEGLRTAIQNSFNAALGGVPPVPPNTQQASPVRVVEVSAAPPKACATRLIETPLPATVDQKMLIPGKSGDQRIVVAEPAPPCPK